MVCGKMSKYHFIIESLVKGRISYSLQGEDILLDYYLQNKKEGFFVDIGAHHPTRFSNTYRLYQKGWRGINIDVTLGSMDIFRKKRPEDTNLEIGISDKKEKKTLFCFNEPALNTFDNKLAKTYIQKGYKLKKRKQIFTQKTSTVLDKYLPKNKNIDLMNIDIEGYDYKAIKANNWQKYRPLIITIEISRQQVKKIQDIMNNEIYKFLLKND